MPPLLKLNLCTCQDNKSLLSTLKNLYTVPGTVYIKKLIDTIN